MIAKVQKSEGDKSDFFEVSARLWADNGSDFIEFAESGLVRWDGDDVQMQCTLSAKECHDLIQWLARVLENIEKTQ